MSARSRQYVSLSLRAFLGMTVCLVVVFLVLGLITTYFWSVLEPDLQTKLLLAFDQAFSLPFSWLHIDISPVALVSITVATLLLALLAIAWLVSVWSFAPIMRLLQVLNGTSRVLPVRAPGEIGLIARHFDALVKQLQQLTKEKQQLEVEHEAALQVLEGKIKVERELHSSLGVNALVSRMVLALQRVYGYERIGIAVLDDQSLTYYFNNELSSEVQLPPNRLPLKDHALAWAAFQRGAAQRVEDLTQQRVSVAPGYTGVRSELVVPIIHNKQYLALFVLQSREPGVFGRKDVELLSQFVEPLALALQNARQFQAEQMRRQLAEAIYRVSQTLSAALAPEGVPEMILDQLAQVLPYDRSMLVLFDQDFAEIQATRGFVHRYSMSRNRIALSNLPLFAEIARSGHAIVLGDAQADERYKPIFGITTTRSWLGTPLVRQGVVTGVLMLENDKPSQYGKEHLHAIAAISHQATIAMENARLKFQLEVVTHITQEVSTRDVSRELPSILRTIIHHIRRVVPCDYAALALYNEEDDTFTIDTVYNFNVTNWDDAAQSYHVAAEGTLWQAAGRTGSTIHRPNLASSNYPYEKHLAKMGLCSGVVVPIMGANRPIGSLDFASRQLGAYNQEQMTTLLELSHYLGSALHNARLSREREETATKLARTQEHLSLVDKVRAVGQLASGVAHDFNNLLSGVLGNAQLLLYEIDDPEQRQMLETIERAAKDGAETVRRLQGFARMEHDTPMTEVRLDSLAADAIELTRPRWRDVAQSRGAKIEILRDLQPVSSIAGRPAELREVLTNLIINAVDALPRGGTIKISTYEKQDDQGNQLVVTDIADSGTGIPAHIRAQIFDPFFTTKGEQGTGLGLSVSLGIIQSHGGDIELESEVGAGTCFSIRLPKRSADPPPRQKIVTSQLVIPGHILFVESEAMVRDATVRVLSRWGHKVVQAVDGAEALRLFQPDLFDLVISDLGMPDMNGWELLSQIKQRDPRVPTILITGWGRQLSDDEARERGVDYVIEKPFDKDDLRAVLAEALLPS